MLCCGIKGVNFQPFSPNKMRQFIYENEPPPHSQQINVTSFLFIIVIPCIPPANNNCCLLQSEWPGIPACRLALNFPCYFLHIWHWWSKSSKSTQWHATCVTSIGLIFRAFSSSDWLIFQVMKLWFKINFEKINSPISKNCNTWNDSLEFFG